MILRRGRVPTRHKNWDALARGAVHEMMTRSGLRELLLVWPDGFATWQPEAKGDFWWEASLNSIRGPTDDSVDLSGYCTVKTNMINEFLRRLGLPEEDLQYQTIIVVPVPWLIRKLEVDSAMYGWLLHNPPASAELAVMNSHFVSVIAPYMHGLCNLRAALAFLENLAEFSSSPKGGQRGGTLAHLSISVLSFFHGDIATARRKCDEYDHAAGKDLGSDSNDLRTALAKQRHVRLIQALRDEYR